MAITESLPVTAPARSRARGLPRGPTESSLLLTWRWLRQPQELLDHCAHRFGEAFTIRLSGLPPLVMFSNPEPVKEIFADAGEDMHAGEAAQSLRVFVGERSLLVLDGKEHMRQRKLLLPPLHGERMEAYGAAMVDLTHEALRSFPIGKPFAIHERMQAITLRVIVRTVFGVEAGSFFETLVARLTELLDVATWPPLILPLFQKDLGRFSPWGRFLRRGAVVDAMLLDRIRERRRSGTTGRSDILSLLVGARDEAGEPMSDAEIRDELVTLLVAGHETTATTLAWAFHWLLDEPLRPSDGH